MRLDDFLSTVGLVKRRTIAKELASNGLVTINDRRAKPAAQVKIGDVIEIKGTRPSKAEVLEIPSGSVPRERRDRYFKTLPIE
jgi:ribosomal 50S subunit-recycling heat shock protein